MNEPVRLIACILLALAPSAFAQTQTPSLLWGVSVTSDLTDNTHLRGALAADRRGDIFAVGYEATGEGCFSALKLSGSDGSILWRRDTCPQVGRAQSVVVDASGDAVVSGYVKRTPNTGDDDFKVVKYSGVDGTVRWERTFNSSNDPNHSQDHAEWVSLDADGNVLVAGQPFNGTEVQALVIKYSSRDGETLWQRAIDGNPGFHGLAGLAAHPSGVTIVSSTSRVIALSTESGEVLWDRHDPDLEDLQEMVLDSAGNPVVADRAGWAAKLRLEDGSPMWKRRTSGNRTSWIAAHPADGSVVVGGGYTTKITSDGTIAWELADSETRGAAIDAQGDVIGIGSTCCNPPLDMVTVKRSGIDGSVVWRDTYNGSANMGDSGTVIIATPDAVVVGGTSIETPPVRQAFRVMKYANVQSPTPLNVQGLWWNAPAGSESGWGVNLAQQGDIIFATWFTYDVDGKGMWLVMSNGARTARNTYAGTLYRSTGPSFSAPVFDPKQVGLTAVGDATFTFSDVSNGTFAYRVNGVAQTKAITRLIFASPVPTCLSGAAAGTTNNYQDLWWGSPAGSESGWGLNITHQGDVLFATWFTYGADGKGQWLVMSNGVKSGEGRYSGLLYRTTGPAFSASPWNPSQVERVQAGSAQLTFSDSANGVFGYSVDGVTQSKRITRMVFASPPSICH